MLWNAQLPHLNATQMTFNCTSYVLGGDFSFSIKLITFFFFLNHSNATKKLYILWDFPILYGLNPWHQFQDDNNFTIRPRNLSTYGYLLGKRHKTPPICPEDIILPKWLYSLIRIQIQASHHHFAHK